MTVYAYTRVSTIAQPDDGESLDVQRRQIDGYAMQHDLAVETHFVERGVSGSLPLAERPQGKLLFAALKPGDIVITPKLDRMFRSALNALDVLAQLKAGGVSLHMIDLGGDVTGNGISKLVFTILSAVAEAERDRTRERIAQVKADQRERSRFLGGTRPFGYQIAADGELVEDAGEQKAIARMCELRGHGLSLRAIAEALADDGIVLSHVAVKKVLERNGGSERSAPEEKASTGQPALGTRW
ncbi:recombinase family protein [Mesorhizobium sp. L48C026A00]|uniref:recombinase family protein n=1 Tax=Mesorhizobium sp. L48C026A00 TaxID=1287182 RepID=UPI0003D0201E|nr:recombinase family protein [Mesorhizobium sp. L48C026A00]ESZ02349.1 resolvase [Mesorhizobium sp. L48C026A00]